MVRIYKKKTLSVAFRNRFTKELKNVGKKHHPCPRPTDFIPHCYDANSYLNHCPNMVLVQSCKSLTWRNNAVCIR
jgi:hypothetical protein